VTPAVYLVFRPEEKHGLSIEDNVVPPAARWKREVNDAVAAHYSIAHLQGQGVAASGEGGEHTSIGMECCEDTQRVPDAVAEPSPVADLCDERRRHSGERVGHQQFAARLKDQNVRVVHTAQGGTDVLHCDAELARERGHGRRLAGAHYLFVNTEAKGGIIDHGGSVIRHWNGSQGFATRPKALAEIQVPKQVSYLPDLASNKRQTPPWRNRKRRWKEGRRVRATSRCGRRRSNLFLKSYYDRICRGKEMLFVRHSMKVFLLFVIALPGSTVGLTAAVAQQAGSGNYPVRARYYETTEEERADPGLQGLERDQVLRRRASLRLVVMISAQLGDSPTVGAGIIFGRAKGKLYVVTANHLVRRGSAVARDIHLRFRDAQDVEVGAVLSPHFDRDSDVAVLEVDQGASRRLDPCSLFLFQLNDGNTLKRGDNVHSVGNPQGVGWGMSVLPEAIAVVESQRILFQSTFLGPGLSGGALLDADGGITALIQSDQQPYGVARRFSAIIPQLRGWNFIVELYHRAPMPQDDDFTFETVLEEAAAKGDLTVVNSLLEACPDVKTLSLEMRTPLHIAAMHGQTGVVNRLIALGADVNAKANTYGLVDYTPLDLAARFGHTEAVRALLAAGADPKGNGKDFTPLSLAVGNGHIEVVKVLASNPALLQVVTQGPGSLLHLAIRKKRLDIAAVLLNAGAPVNARDSNGFTPLHIAVIEDFADAIPLLLKAGADPNATDNSGKGPLARALNPEKRKQFEQMFQSFARGN
jgi:ankyrin repeat protein